MTAPPEALVTVPVIVPLVTKAKLTFAVDDPAVTAIGVPFVTPQLFAGQLMPL